MKSPYILCIETSSGYCSVALSYGNTLVSQAIENQKNKAADKLNLLVDTVMNESKLTFKELDAIAISGGPGSYTGLRIGVSVAKGLAYALKIPLIHVETFFAMKAQVENVSDLKFDQYIPMIDARRMDAFTAIINNQNEYILEPECITIDEDFIEKWCQSYRNVIFGHELDKFNILLQNKTFIIYLNNINLEAKYMIALATDKYLKNQFEDIAYYEPKYYKLFHSSSKKSIP
jgi:tRNA threonylcarbamoyladenosine biosynthesis protein TsaB